MAASDMEVVALREQLAEVHSQYITLQAELDLFKHELEDCRSENATLKEVNRELEGHKRLLQITNRQLSHSLEHMDTENRTLSKVQNDNASLVTHVSLQKQSSHRAEAVNERLMGEVDDNQLTIDRLRKENKQLLAKHAQMSEDHYKLEFEQNMALEQAEELINELEAQLECMDEIEQHEQAGVTGDNLEHMNDVVSRRSTDGTRKRQERSRTHSTKRLFNHTKFQTLMGSPSGSAGHGYTFSNTLYSTFFNKSSQCAIKDGDDIEEDEKDLQADQLFDDELGYLQVQKTIDEYEEKLNEQQQTYEEKLTEQKKTHETKLERLKRQMQEQESMNVQFETRMNALIVQNKKLKEKPQSALFWCF